MTESNWKFAKEFKSYHERGLRLAKAFKKDWEPRNSTILSPTGQPFEHEFNDEPCDGTALIEWTGNTDFDWLWNAMKNPPFDVSSIERDYPEEEFICWLMLPKDSPSVIGDKWYFGRVFSKRKTRCPSMSVSFSTWRRMLEICSVATPGSATTYPPAWITRIKPTSLRDFQPFTRG